MKYQNISRNFSPFSHYNSILINKIDAFIRITQQIKESF